MHIQLSGQVRMQDVVGAIEPLRDAARKGKVELDMTGVRGMDRVAGPVLTQELFTFATEARVVIRAPERNWESLLAQSGLLFFLAGHSKREVIAARDVDAALDSWRKPWTRGSHAQRTLFDDDTRVEPTTFRKREYAAFVNPHLIGRLTGSHDVSNVVQPWLAQFLPPRITSNREFLADVALIIDELLSNVCDHAANAKSLPQLRSLVLVAMARGKDEGVRDRVHITVLDTGVGILSSASKKIGRRTSVSELFSGLFKGGENLISHARGFGLPQVWDRVRRRKDGRLFAIANGHSIEAAGGMLTPTALGHESLGGSIVTTTLPAPKFDI